MPLIEYLCEKCSSQFEILTGVSQDSDDLICPDCGSEKVSRQLSAFSSKAAVGAAAPSPAPAPSGGGCGAGCGCHR